MTQKNKNNWPWRDETNMKKADQHVRQSMFIYLCFNVFFSECHVNTEQTCLSGIVFSLY